MTDIIRDAVMVGCNTVLNIWDPTMSCAYPDCECDHKTAIETAVRHAAEAVANRAADMAMEHFQYGDVLADAIRAIPTEGDMT